MKEKSHLGTLWASMWNSSYGAERRVFAALELLFFPLSLLTVFVLLPLQIVAKHMAVEIPTTYLLAFHVLLPAAFGYITNYITLEIHLVQCVTSTHSKFGCLPSFRCLGCEVGQLAASRQV